MEIDWRWGGKKANLGNLLNFQTMILDSCPSTLNSLYTLPLSALPVVQSMY